MKLAHNIKISVFCKEGEDKELIKEKLVYLIPFNIEKEKVKLKETKAIGFGQKEIIIAEINLEKDRHINEFLRDFNGKLNEEHKGLLVRQVSSRLDNGLNFFIRLDKEKWLNKELFITDSGDCFHIKISIAAFPARIENAVKIIKEIFC